MSFETPSRPLPRITVDQPSADCGADEVREHLDTLERCYMCDAPVGEDEQNIRADYFGTFHRFNICKQHMEHPDSWSQAVHEQHHA